MRIPRPRVQGCVVFLYMLIGFRSGSKNSVTLNLDRTSMHPVVRAIGKVLRLVGDIESGGFDAEARDALRSAFVEDSQSFRGEVG